MPLFELNTIKWERQAWSSEGDGAIRGARAGWECSNGVKRIQKLLSLGTRPPKKLIKFPSFLHLPSESSLQILCFIPS